MSKQIITLFKDGVKDFEIQADAYQTFEDFYQLGMVLEQYGYTDEGFAGKQAFAPKYLNWAKVVRLMHFFDKDFKWETVKFTKKEDINGQLVDVYRPFYQTDRAVSFVGIKFTFRGKEYYQEQPIMGKGNFNDVEIVQGTRVDFSQRRALVKGVAEHLGLGLHLWSKIEVEELEAAGGETTTKKVVKTKTTASKVKTTTKDEAPKTETETPKVKTTINRQNVDIKVETPKNEVKTQVEKEPILPKAADALEGGNILPKATTKVEKVVEKATHLTDEEFKTIMSKVKPALVGLSTSGHANFVQELTTTLLAKHKVEKLSLLPKVKETLVADLINPIKEYRTKNGIK